MADSTAVIHPKFHHFNLKTTRLQEMIDFYAVLVGAEVNFQDDVGAWLSNDAANHRIALLAFPGFTDDPEKETRTGLHHTAFEYAGFDELNAELPASEGGGHRAVVLHRSRHDVLLLLRRSRRQPRRAPGRQLRRLGESTEWMRTSEEFKANPIGQFVDPERVASDHAADVEFDQIHARAMAGDYAPEQAPVEIPDAS